MEINNFLFIIFCIFIYYFLYIILLNKINYSVNELEDLVSKYSSIDF